MSEKKEINVHIGNKIRSARETAGLTQEKFSELVNLAPKNISDIERGVVGVSVASLVRICDVLSVSSDSLLFAEKEDRNNVAKLAERLEKLTPQQYEIASAVINKLFEAFALSK